MDLTQFHWNTFRKIPVTIEAMELKTPQIIETLEGPAKANAGDMMIRSIAGTHSLWHPERFAEHYEAVDDDTQVESSPDSYSVYQSRPQSIQATRVFGNLEIATKHGTIIAEQDDILVRRRVCSPQAGDDIYTLKPWIFTQLYELDRGMTCFQAFNPDVHLINTLKDFHLPAQGIKSFAFITIRYHQPSHVLWWIEANHKVVVYREWRASDKTRQNVKQTLLKYNAEGRYKPQSLWCAYNDLADLRQEALDVRCTADYLDLDVVRKKTSHHNNRILERIIRALQEKRLFITKDAYVGETGHASLCEELQTYAHAPHRGMQTLGLLLGVV